MAPHYCFGLFSEVGALVREFARNSHDDPFIGWAAPQVKSIHPWQRSMDFPWFISEGNFKEL